MRKPWDDPNPVRVELATNPRAQAPVWSDISAAVKGNPGITVDRTGRSGMFQTTSPNRCSLTLDNTTAAFSDIAGSAPTLFQKRLRVSVRDWTINGNVLLNPDFNLTNGVANWGGAAFGYAGTATLTHSSTRSLFGHGRSMLVTWPTQAASTAAYALAGGLVLGRQYEAVLIVWVGSGPAVTLKDLFGASGGTTNATGAWQVIRFRFTASSDSHAIGIVASATTAGQQVWVGAARVDEGWSTAPLVANYTSLAAAGHTNTPLVGATGSPVSYRFTGDIASNRTGWTMRRSTTPVSGVDRSARLASRTRTFRSVPIEEQLSDNPWCLYPLNEPDSSTSAGDASPNELASLVATGTGSAVLFGATQLTPTSPDTGATFAGGQYLTTSWPNGGVGGVASYSLGAVFRTTAAVSQALVAVGDSFGPMCVLSTTAAGKVRFDWPDAFDNSGAARPTLTSSATVNDGQPHTCHVTGTLAGGTVTFRLYVDGVRQFTLGAITTPFLPFGTILTVGGAQGYGSFTGVIGLASAWSTAVSQASITEHTSAALTGFTGEETYGRLIRYCRWAGIPQSEIVLDATGSYLGLMAHVDSTDRSPWDMMALCETVEGGLLNIDGAGRVRFRSRSSFYNPAAAATLTADYSGGGALGVLQNSLEFPVDTSNLVNDIEGARPGGATQRTINQASIDEYQRAEDSVTIPATTDQAVADALAWRVALLSNPQPVMEGLGVALSGPNVDDALTAQILALEPGTRVDVTNLPPQAPASTMSAQIEGWQERYTHADGAVWSANGTSPLAPAVWTIEDPTNGALDGASVIAY